MTRSYLFALLTIAVAGGTGLATDRPGSVDSRPDVEGLLDEHSLAGPGFTGAIELGPVIKTAGFDNPFAPVANTGEASSEQNARSIRNARQSVEEWLQGDGYALSTDEATEYWHWTNGCEMPPITRLRTSQLDLPLLTPQTVRNQRGKEITFVPGMKPAELIKLIQPLPDCVHKLMRLDRSFIENGGIRHSLLLESEYAHGGRLQFGIGVSSFDPIPNDFFVTSKLFPNHLFCLHFEGIAVPELKRVQIVDGSHLMWLRHAHGESLPKSDTPSESIDSAEGDLVADSMIRQAVEVQPARPAHSPSTPVR